MKITCIVAVGKDGGIGINENKLPWNIPNDMRHFKEITSNKIIVMGRNTYESIPEHHRPLKSRLNVVISTQEKKQTYDNLIYCSYSESLDIIQKNTFSDECVIIGGQEIYNLFKDHITKIYLTEVQHPYPIVYTKHFFKIPYCFKIIKFSSLFQHENIKYRYIEYERFESVTQEHDATYLNLCTKVLTNGEDRSDRTGTGTIAIFGEQMKFDLSHSLPILTTKRVPWKSCIEELLWFMRGDTNSQILNSKGVKIWNLNSTREFLDDVGLSHLEAGDCGANYSFQWRHFGAEYINCNTVYGCKGTDQIEYIENELRHNPYSRRIFMSAWNPCDLNKTVLPPCHVSCQFYVDNSNKLHCHMYQRSCDMFLGVPWNILSYSILTHILAFRNNFLVGSLTISTGDTHIYKDHLEQVKKQLTRESLTAPILVVKDCVRTKRIDEIDLDDFEIVGYFPHDTIKARMSA